MNKTFCSTIPSHREIQPSIIYYCEGIFKALANCSLLNSGYVKNPITEEPVDIAFYRLMDGIEIENGLMCSIYPSFDNYSTSPPSPTSTKASAVYNNYDLGPTNYEVIYHFVIKYTYKDVSIEGTFPSENPNLITVPLLNLADPEDVPFNSKSSKEVSLYHNPPLSIISEYLELTRMVLLTPHWVNRFFDNNSISVLYQNYPTISWSDDANSYFHYGHLLIAVKAIISTGWEDKYNLPLEKINLLDF